MVINHLLSGMILQVVFQQFNPTLWNEYGKHMQWAVSIWAAGCLLYKRDKMDNIYNTLGIQSPSENGNGP